MKARVTTRGRVTIPKELRERLGIRPGDAVELAAEDGALVIRPTWLVEMLALVGTLQTPYSTDEMIEMMRGPAEFPD